IATDEVQRGDDGDAPLPERSRLRQPIERLAAALLEVRADHVRGGDVDEVPVVDAAGVAEVETEDRGARGGRAAVLLDQDHQCDEAVLVPRRGEQRGRVGERELAELTYDKAHGRDG